MMAKMSAEVRYCKYIIVSVCNMYFLSQRAVTSSCVVSTLDAAGNGWEDRSSTASSFGGEGRRAVMISSFRVPRAEEEDSRRDPSLSVEGMRVPKQ